MMSTTGINWTGISNMSSGDQLESSSIVERVPVSIGLIFINFLIPVSTGVI